MDMNIILGATGVIGGLGLVFALGLGVAAKIFEVKQDPLIPKVREALPGANCGGCGYAGCDAYAKAVVGDGVACNKCPVGGADVAAKVAEIMGQEVGDTTKMVAFVKCQGTCDKAKEKYIYEGVSDCKNAAFLQGQGSKGCTYGCLGLGSCVAVCEYDAISIVDGIAKIDPAKCVSCGKCVAECPKELIELVPDDKKVRVTCNSKEKGKTVKVNCDVGCIGCRMCTKVCETEAITVENNIAHIDYEKCTECGACVEKCPVNAIINYN